MKLQNKKWKTKSQTKQQNYANGDGFEKCLLNQIGLCVHIIIQFAGCCFLSFQLVCVIITPKWNYFGAAMHNGNLVVNSGYTNSKTTQLFDAELKQWKYVAATNKLRAYHALVAAEGSLFAIGGWNVKSKQSVSSGKRWAELNG